MLIIVILKFEFGDSNTWVIYVSIIYLFICLFVLPVGTIRKILLECCQCTYTCMKYDTCFQEVFTLSSAKYYIHWYCLNPIKTELTSVYCNFCKILSTIFQPFHYFLFILAPLAKPSRNSISEHGILLKFLFLLESESNFFFFFSKLHDCQNATLLVTFFFLASFLVKFNNLANGLKQKHQASFDPLFTSGFWSFKCIGKNFYLT